MRNLGINSSARFAVNETNTKQLISGLLQLAGIEINGPNPWDPQIHNDGFYGRVLKHGHLGLGETYMDGWWDCKRLDEFIYRALRAQLDREIQRNPRRLLQLLLVTAFNMQAKSRAFHIGEKHYDTGNDLFEVMLDKRLTYTCGYWKEASNLDEAQEAKLDLVCRKVGLKSGQKVLDIGCGWGNFAKFAAENYGVSVVGITVSKEQVELGRKRCERLPVEIRLQDYRDLNEKFDRIVSIGMFEHVGYKNYRTFMKKVDGALSDDGLFLLQTFGNTNSAHQADPWFQKYIFPGGMIPSIRQIGGSMEKLFVMEDWHNFGADYDKTLMAWRHNFTTGWNSIKQNYSEKFYRMWTYYLLSLAGAFRARKIQLWQIVFSKTGVVGGHQSIR